MFIGNSTILVAIRYTAIYNFVPNGVHQLHLNVGQTVHILEETTDWFRGYVVSNKTQKGIFPRNYIHVKPATVQITGSVETIKSTELALVHEMTEVLREWHAIWKQQFVNMSADIEKVRRMILDLIDWRRKILTRKYTVDEQKVIQQQVTNLIDSGNALLHLDMVVRDDKGNLLDPSQHSVIGVYRRHVAAADQIRKRSSLLENEGDMRPPWPLSFNLFVMIRNFVCKIGEDSDILMNIYDSKEGKFISDNYVVNWGKRGVPKDVDMLNNFRVVYTDLGSRDRQREKVFLVFQIVRIGVMDPKNVDNKKQTQGIRRPFGVGAMDISDFMVGLKDTKEDHQYFIPFQQCGQGEFMDNVIKKVITAREINHKGQGLWVSLKVMHGDLKQAQEEQIHLLLPGTAVSRKIGFPDVIMPGDIRNDIYLTLRQGDFSRGAKTTDKNVDITVHVCDYRGKVMKEVINFGCGGDMMSEYKSMVYYHEDNPKWFETFKIAISTEVEFKGLHVKFSFRHRATNEGKDKIEKVFALAYVPLMNSDGTTIEDKTHDLIIYKIEGKRHEDDASYLKLPPTRQLLEACGIQHSRVTSGPFIQSPKESLSISTFVCSTKLTHNVDLLGLLKWKEVLDNSKALTRHLNHLMKEEGEEIVKFLQDLLDSLFNILLQNNNSDLCDDLVFNALVYIIALISDRKYHQFRPVLNAYIETSFSFSMAYNKLMVILKDYVDKSNEYTGHEMLLRAVKSLEYIFKFIIRSRVLFSMINEGRGKHQFQISLKDLLKSFNTMMLYKSEHTLLIQGAALKYISSIIDNVLTVFDPIELSNLMVEFFNNVAKDRLVKTKLTSINQIVQTGLFKIPECRAVILPSFLQHVRDLMEMREETECCVNILSNVMDQLWGPDLGGTEVDVAITMNIVLRTVIQSVVNMDQGDALVKTNRKVEKILGHRPPQSMSMIRCPVNESSVSVMISILRQMTPLHYQKYIASFLTSFDLLDFLMEILLVFRDLVGRCVYPSDWMEMIMMQNSVILRALRFFSATIYQHFSSPFEEQLWSNFFQCAISFLIQEPLQLEKFSLSKCHKIVSRYNDMRRETGFEIRSMWSNLGVNKIRFIPTLVGPFLEMTLIPEIELRRATIPIFFDMMHCEYTQPAAFTLHPQENFQEFENKMITQLDVLVEGGRGDEEYRDLMFQTLVHLCDKEPGGLREQGKVFVKTIWKLLERLLVYRHVIQDEVKEHVMSCIVNLLDFYHDINRQEMYIRYLHKLCQLHLDCDNYTEAAYVILLYTNLLQWSDEPLCQLMYSAKYPTASYHRDLKELLYYEAISYFEKGKMWEKGIELCEELAALYREELFDYCRLSKILKRQAEMYDCILREMRPEPEYFRVGYFGLGFPSFLQNKTFIYRGKEYERIADFNSRMQVPFPKAELMKTLDTPNEEILLSDKQFLQINSVSPVLQLKEQFEDKAIIEQILKYYRVNEIQVFTYSRRMDEGVSDITKMWLERTSMTTSYPLPGIVGWYPVVATETVKVSPIESAIETMEDKNKNIATLIEQHRHNANLGINPLSMTLNGVVDAAVQGGTAMYKTFYIDPEYDPVYQERMKTLTMEQVSLLKDGLMIHKQRAPDSLMPFQLRMEQCFGDMCNMIEQELGIEVTDSVFVSCDSATLRRNQSTPNTAVHRGSDDSVCSVNISLCESSCSNSTTPRNSASRSQSVWVKDKSSISTTPLSSKLSKVSLSSLIKRVSLVTDQRRSGESSSDGSSQWNSSELIELSEKLTTHRPNRPDSEHRPSRPSSAQMSSKTNSAASLTSEGFTCQNRLSDGSDFMLTPEEPPPLPEKQMLMDQSVPPPIPRRSSRASKFKPTSPVPSVPPCRSPPHPNVGGGNPSLPSS